MKIENGVLLEYTDEDLDRFGHAIIPEGVTKIGNWAFRDCKALKKTTIPEGVTELGVQAFIGCHSLKEVALPESLKKIGVAAFMGCKNIQEIALPEGISEIGRGVFAFCMYLHIIKIGDIKIKPSADIDEYLGLCLDFIRKATLLGKKLPDDVFVMKNTNANYVENFYKKRGNWTSILKKYLDKWRGIDYITLKDGAEGLYKLSIALGALETGKTGQDAKQFIIDNIAHMSPEDIHNLFRELNTKEHGYSEGFAKFFMANYVSKSKDGKFFMDKSDKQYCDSVNYIAKAYNSWDKIEEVYRRATASDVSKTVGGVMRVIDKLNNAKNDSDLPDTDGGRNS